MPTDNEDDDDPTLRQMLHAATGDRAAEADALADRTDAPVSEDDAKVAVRQAHGDVAGGDAGPSDLATPEDAESVHDDSEGPDGAATSRPG